MADVDMKILAHLQKKNIALTDVTGGQEKLINLSKTIKTQIQSGVDGSCQYCQRTRIDDPERFGMFP